MIKSNIISIQFLMASGSPSTNTEPPNQPGDSKDLINLSQSLQQIRSQFARHQEQAQLKQKRLTSQINQLLAEKQESRNSKELQNKKLAIFDPSIIGLFDKQNAENLKLKKQSMELRKKLYEFKESLAQNKTGEEVIGKYKAQVENLKKNLGQVKGEKNKLEEQNIRLRKQKDELERNVRNLSTNIQEKDNTIKEMNENNNYKINAQNTMKFRIADCLKKPNQNLQNYIHRNTKTNQKIFHFNAEQHSLIEFSQKLLEHLLSYNQYSSNISSLLSTLKHDINHCMENPKSLQRLEQMKIQTFRTDRINPVTCTYANKTAQETVQLLNILFDRVRILAQTERSLQERNSEVESMKKEINVIAVKLKQFRDNRDIVTVDNKNMSHEAVAIFRNINDGIFRLKKEINERGEKIKELGDEKVILNQKIQRMIREISEQRETNKRQINRIKEEKNNIVLQNSQQNRRLKDEHSVILTNLKDAHTTQLNKLKITHQSSLEEVRLQCLAKHDELELKKKQSAQQQQDMKNTIQRLQAQIQGLKEKNIILTDDLTRQNKRQKELDQKKQQFFSRLNSTINEAFPDTSEIFQMSLDKQEFGLKEFEHQLIANANIPKYLVQSELFNSFDKEMKKFFDKQIRGLIPGRKIAGSKTIVICDKLVKASSWIQLCFGRPNILMLLKMSNGTCIAGFSEEPLSNQIRKQGVGCILSLNKKKKYKLKPRPDASILKYSPYFFSFGNDEIVVKGEGIVTSLFGTSQNYFDPSGDKRQDLFGEQEGITREMKYDQVQFHELFFE